ncbi:MAG: hypothetical protein Q9166_004900 [cf. Caloplaca sp. 2 TL-2023]
MGLPSLSSLNPFSSSNTPSPQSPKPSADGAFIAPDRNSRAKCYEARDAFFQCLDKYGILDAIKEEDMAKKACGDAEKIFGRECAGSWRRVMEWKKQQTLDKLQAEGAWVPEGAPTPAVSRPQMPK